MPKPMLAASALAAPVLAGVLAGLAGCGPEKSARPPAPKAEWVLGSEQRETLRPGVAFGATARCKPGMQPLSGTWRASSQHLTELLIEISKPVDGGWFVAVRNQSDAPVNAKLRAIVLCAEGLPTPPQI